MPLNVCLLRGLSRPKTPYFNDLKKCGVKITFSLKVSFKQPKTLLEILRGIIPQ